MSRLLCLVIAASGAVNADPGALRPVVIDSPVASDEVFVASLSIEPPAGDATAMIQAAIDRCAAAGGAVLYLAPGRYRLDGPIVLREGVILLGAGQDETILAVYGGRGEPDAPATVTMERGSGVRYLTFWHPEQEAAAPVPYPWTLRTSAAATGDNTTVEQVRLVNAWQAISIGPEWNELHTIRNVTATALKTGIRIDTVTDIGRVVDSEFSPKVWETSGLPGAPAGPAAEALRGWLRREAVGIDMGRSDWQYIDGLTVRGYAIGVKLRPGEQGTTNGVMLDCHLSGDVGLQFDKLNGIGLAAAWSTFEGDTAAVRCTETFDTVAQFTACTLRSEAGVGLLQQGTGTLTLHHCELNAGGAAVETVAGQLVMQACRYGDSPLVRLGEGVRRARILGSAADEPARVESQSTGDVQVAATGVNPALCPRPEPSSLRWPTLPTRNLVLVTDHGASPELDDNTAAFQAALDAAGGAGGGTVYVPAGGYRFAGELTVPSGVELRGIFDVPHHTVSAGSVLMPTANRGTEEGVPFVSLAEGSGLRGITFWYPEQNLTEFAPYPWTVQSLGPGCWLRDVTCGNSYNGIDFWTHPSDGHVISYLAGTFFRRGLQVSKCAGPGWVEDVQMNPHYSARLHDSLPRPEYPGDVFGGVIDQQRHYLDALVFGRCDDERIRRTFLYAAHDGIAFRDDEGGATATVLIHGSDTVSRSAVLEGGREVDFVLAQLVPLSEYEVGGIVTTERFDGRARFFCNQMWAGNVGGRIAGGEVLIQQWNNITGPLHVTGGRVTLESGIFPAKGEAAVEVGPLAESVRLVGNLERGPFRIANAAGERLTAVANSASVVRRATGPTSIATDFEDGAPQPFVDTIATTGGGIRAVSEASCRPADGEGFEGSRALRISGRPDDDYAFAYFRLFDGPLQVMEDTVLRYAIRPGDAASRSSGVDLLFSDGATLRDLGLGQRGGGGTHPANERGTPGAWTTIEVSLGAAAGRTITAIMFAYDSHSAQPFESYLDNLEIRSSMGGDEGQVACDPAGGRVTPTARITLTAPAGVRLVYTLDGTNPTAESPVYAGPLALGPPGLRELRYAVLRDDGTVGSLVRSALFEVTP